MNKFYVSVAGGLLMLVGWRAYASVRHDRVLLKNGETCATAQKRAECVSKNFCHREGHAALITRNTCDDDVHPRFAETTYSCHLW